MDDGTHPTTRIEPDAATHAVPGLESPESRSRPQPRLDIPADVLEGLLLGNWADGIGHEVA